MIVKPADLTDDTDHKFLWVCDYRYKDISNKPIRHVKPTIVAVVHNSKTKKRVYYSEYHLAPIGKKGQVLKQVIPIFDNTGYRSYTGVPLQMFTTEIECIAAYKELQSEVLKQLESWYEQVTYRYGTIKGEIE